MSIKIKRVLGAFTMFFVLGLLITIPLTTYHILYSIDPQTHFYFDNAKFVSLTNIILTVITIILILPFFIRKKAVGKVAFHAKGAAFGVFSALMAVLLCAESLYNIAKTFSSTAGVGGFLTGSCGLLATIFFIVLAVGAFRGKGMDLRILALMPVLWSVVNLIATFMSLTQVANISEYLYEVLQMVFATLFFYYNARLVGDVPNGHEVSGVFAFGLPCAFFSLLSSLPPVIARLIDSSRGSLPNVHYAVFVATALYILTLLISLLKSKPEKAEASEQESNK